MHIYIKINFYHDLDSMSFYVLEYCSQSTVVVHV